MNERINKCTGFDWDDGNDLKNWKRHNVSMGECEQVFFSEPLIIQNDTRHSLTEHRWYLLGKTDSGRLIFLVFTVRRNLIRVISARDMNKKEREIYNEKVKTNTGIQKRR
jgi:hypothetical protein